MFSSWPNYIVHVSNNGTFFPIGYVWFVVDWVTVCGTLGYGGPIAMGRGWTVCSKNLDFEKHSKSQPANFKGPVLAYKKSDPCDYGVMTERKNAHFKRKCHWSYLTFEWSKYFNKIQSLQFTSPKSKQLKLEGPRDSMMGVLIIQFWSRVLEIDN